MTIFHDNFYDNFFMTINFDTGQHSQFLQCFNLVNHSRGPFGITSQLLLCDSPRKLSEENLSPENRPRGGNYDFVELLHSNLSVANPSDKMMMNVNGDDECL